MRTPVFAFALVVAASAVSSQNAASQQPSGSIPQEDSSYVDAQGTAYVTRIVPLPTTVSPQAQKYLTNPVPHAGPDATVAENRASTDAMQTRDSAGNLALYPVHIAQGTIAGITVRIVTPVDPIPAAKSDRVLICLHGGGFTTDSGSLTESIPIAHLTRTKVISVLYRLAPESPFPAAVDDSVAVYKELLRTYKPDHIVIYGTSAGAILTAEVAVKLKQLSLPLPAALGIFSGMGDFARAGDSASLYSLRGLSGHLDPPTPGSHNNDYMTITDPRDPVLSPIYADLHGLPPTLFVTSGRDLLLSGTVNLHRAYIGRAHV